MKAWRILRKEGYKPYKIHISHTLQPGDPERRLVFCQWFTNQRRQNPNFIYNIIWSDECKFTNCGLFNRNNEHVWATENPRINRQVRPQIRFGVNVWAGLYNNRIFGFWLFEENLTGNVYLNFLNTQFQEFLMNVPLATLPHLWFQQDGAPPHNTRAVHEFLNREFPGKWLGNRGAVEWPARSPDLSPMDFFLWGVLKNKVYKTPINNLEDLRERIVHSFGTLRARSIERAIRKSVRNANKCIDANGHLFEHL